MEYLKKKKRKEVLIIKGRQRYLGRGLSIYLRAHFHFADHTASPPPPGDSENISPVSLLAFFYHPSSHFFFYIQTKYCDTAKYFGTHPGRKQTKARRAISHRLLNASRQLKTCMSLTVAVGGAKSCGGGAAGRNGGGGRVCAATCGTLADGGGR